MGKSRSLRRRIGPVGPEALVAVVVLALLVSCIFVVPRLLVPARVQPTAGITVLDRLRLENERLKLRNDVRTTMLQAMGGALFLITALLTWRQIQINREGQITERFTRAIDHLGSEDKVEVRLGGIYALERIANDSATERGSIVEILTAYVRGRAIRTDAEDAPPQVASLQIRAPDVQAAMTVLGRRPMTDGGPDVLQLARVDLRKVLLPKAELQSANLDAADLSAANLREANLREANLENADVAHADLERARLDAAVLRGAKLRGSNLKDSSLVQADLRSANLGEATLQSANLETANLQKANLWEVNLDRANLRGANLEGAMLVRANLVDASLSGAILRGATLTGATMQGAEMTGARADRRTAWPQEFDWSAAGAVIEDL
jgi:uncharacterized protein YjbI with pentapeptide repeats